MRPVHYDAWEPFYKAILADFGFDPGRDEEAARRLAQMLVPRQRLVDAAWDELRRRFAIGQARVVGAGDRAREELTDADDVGPLVAADGATTAVLEAGLQPTLIVTDLDGDVEDQVEAAHQGAFVAVHAHGDNLPALTTWVPRFPPERVVGTSQCRPPAPLRNEGGFTDGDRACFLAAALGATRIDLVGFDFSGRVGRFTGTFDPRTKPKKLMWARRLLGELSARGVHLAGFPPPPTPGTRAGRPA